jgi:quercetin dioxygenase-like cupin family protein
VQTQTLQPHLNTRHDDPFLLFGGVTTLRATGATTNGAFGLLDSLMPPGMESPYHVHTKEDEAFYVIEGEVALVVDGTWMVAGPGTYAFGPRGVPHGFKVVSDTPARMLLLWTPGGFEHFVNELRQPEPAPGAQPEPLDMRQVMAAAARADIQILGPLPEFVR